MWFHIDTSSGTPIYRQIFDQVRQAVAGGTMRPGDRLPSVRDMAVELAVNPNTIAKAYQELERDGVIETPRGRGSFISAQTPELTPTERNARVRTAIDRLIAEAYHLSVPDEELHELVKRRLTERRRDGGNE